MPVHLWTVLCRECVIDKFTNQASLHTITEQIKLTWRQPEPDHLANPSIQVDFNVASLWIRSDLGVPEKSKCRLRLITPGDPQPTNAPKEIEINLETHVRARTIFRVGGMAYRGSGTYYFVMEEGGENGWREVARQPLIIEVEKKEADAEVPD